MTTSGAYPAARVLDLLVERMASAAREAPAKLDLQIAAAQHELDQFAHADG